MPNTAAETKSDSAAAGAAPVASKQSAPSASPAREVADILGTALNMLGLIASKAPAGSGLRNAIDAECAAMQAAARSIVARATMEQPVTVSIKTADGWAVTLAKRSRLGGAWFYDLQYFDSWYDAQDCYEDPPRDWQATAIHACRNGEPFARLSAYKIAQLRSEA